MSKIAGLKNAACGFALGIGLAAGLGAVPALAQQAPPPRQGGMMRARHPLEPPFMHMCTDLDARQAAALAFARVKLAITDAEKPAWAQFVEQAKASAVPMQELCKNLQGKPWPKTLPEHLAFAEQIADAHVKRLQILRPAAEQLYGQLSPEQKETADRMLDRIGEAGPMGPGRRVMIYHPQGRGHGFGGPPQQLPDQP